ncbi:MAG: hypothetical protein O7F12_07625 [Nitrospirae bacterium]|nr:hypothetical protein [Nitrospirota bacterium]
MPYEFPYADEFVWGISLLIGILFVVRWYVGRRVQGDPEKKDPPSHSNPNVL